jgi:hypothetical protein
MKITKDALKQLIKEELDKVNEGWDERQGGGVNTPPSDQASRMYEDLSERMREMQERIRRLEKKTSRMPPLPMRPEPV